VALVKKHNTAPHYNSCSLTRISSSTSHARPKKPPWKHRQAPTASRIKNNELLKSESTSGTMKSISCKTGLRQVSSLPLARSMHGSGEEIAATLKRD
jgi:hypothetical protein